MKQATSLIDHNDIRVATASLTKTNGITIQSGAPYARFTYYALSHYLPTGPNLEVSTPAIHLIEGYRAWAAQNSYRHESYVTDNKLIQYLGRHLVCLDHLVSDVVRDQAGYVVIKGPRALSKTGLSPNQMPVIIDQFGAHIEASLRASGGPKTSLKPSQLAPTILGLMQAHVAGKPAGNDRSRGGMTR